MPGDSPIGYRRAWLFKAGLSLPLGFPHGPCPEVCCSPYSILSHSSPHSLGQLNGCLCPLLPLQMPHHWPVWSQQGQWSPACCPPCALLGLTDRCETSTAAAAPGAAERHGAGRAAGHAPPPHCLWLSGGINQLLAPGADAQTLPPKHALPEGSKYTCPSLRLWTELCTRLPIP